MDGDDVNPAGTGGDPGAGTLPAAPPAAAVSHAGTPLGTGYRLAAGAACAAVVVAVVAVLEQDPGRHVRGLLLVVALVLAISVVSAWVRVVRALRA